MYLPNNKKGLVDLNKENEIVPSKNGLRLKSDRGSMHPDGYSGEESAMLVKNGSLPPLMSTKASGNFARKTSMK